MSRSSRETGEAPTRVRSVSTATLHDLWSTIGALADVSRVERVLGGLARCAASHLDHVQVLIARPDGWWRLVEDDGTIVIWGPDPGSCPVRPDDPELLLVPILVAGGRVLCLIAGRARPHAAGARRRLIALACATRKRLLVRPAQATGTPAGPPSSDTRQAA